MNLCINGESVDGASEALVERGQLRDDVGGGGQVADRRESREEPLDLGHAVPQIQLQSLQI